MRIELGVGFGHCVEDGQQLAHAGDQGDLLEFAGGEETLVEGADGRIVAGGTERGQVQDSAQFEAPTSKASSAAVLIRVLGVGRDTDPRGDLAAVEPAQLGQVGEQTGRGDWPDATGRLEQRIQFGVMRS